MPAGDARVAAATTAARIPGGPRSTMSAYAEAEQDRAPRFREMRNVADAEDAVEERYLPALRHFDSYRGPTIQTVVAGDLAQRV
jgi:hypothetical protein